MEEVLLLGQVEAGALDFKPTPLDLAHFSARLADEVRTRSFRSGTGGSASRRRIGIDCFRLFSGAATWGTGPAPAWGW
jgi:hypothetical protein